MAEAHTIVATKTCSRCKKIAPLTYFAPTPATRKNPNRRHSHCRDCASETTRRYKALAKAKAAAEEPWRQFRYVSKDDYLRAFEARGNMPSKYGITLEQYCEMVERQKARCAICKQRQPGRNLAIDHCHRTGVVRALLCLKCNHGIGSLGESPERLMAAIEYIRRHSTALI